MSFHREYIDLSDDIVCVGAQRKGVAATKIGAALLRHLAKYPDVLSTAQSAPDPYAEILHSQDIPQKDDL